MHAVSIIIIINDNYLIFNEKATVSDYSTLDASTQRSVYLLLDQVVQSCFKITWVSAKFEFRFESLKSKFSLILSVSKFMMRYS